MSGKNRKPQNLKTPAPKTRKSPVSSQPFFDINLISRNGGLEEMKERLNALQHYIASDPTRRPDRKMQNYIQRACSQYEKAVKASIGVPTYSDSVTLQSEASPDIPTVPLSGFQLVDRVCYIPKTATSGTTAGGFYAELSSADLAPFTGTSTFYRLKRVTSWTVPRQDGNVNQGSFAGQAVPAGLSAGGTEVMPTWSENFTPIGKGFAGITVRYPLGDFPQLSSATTGATTILNHYTSLGGTGGVTGIPVIFHVEIECLV